MVSGESLGRAARVSGVTRQVGIFTLDGQILDVVTVEAGPWTDVTGCWGWLQ